MWWQTLHTGSLSWAYTSEKDNIIHKQHFNRIFFFPIVLAALTTFNIDLLIKWRFCTNGLRLTSKVQTKTESPSWLMIVEYLLFSFLSKRTQIIIYMKCETVTLIQHSSIASPIWRYMISHSTSRAISATLVTITNILTECHKTKHTGDDSSQSLRTFNSWQSLHPHPNYTVQHNRFRRLI